MPSPKGTTDGPSACWHHRAGAAGACQGHQGYKMEHEPLEQSPWSKIHRKGSGLSISRQESRAFIQEEASALQAASHRGDKSLPPALEDGNFPLLQDLQLGRTISRALANSPHSNLSRIYRAPPRMSLQERTTTCRILHCWLKIMSRACIWILEGTLICKPDVPTPSHCQLAPGYRITPSQQPLKQDWLLHTFPSLRSPRHPIRPHSPEVPFLQLLPLVLHCPGVPLDREHDLLHFSTTEPEGRFIPC